MIYLLPIQEGGVEPHNIFLLPAQLSEAGYLSIPNLHRTATNAPEFNTILPLSHQFTRL
jgi:hypothetical protein